jgi:hypothetical protein
VSFSAVAAPGKPFSNWGGDCASAGGNTTCTLRLDQDKTISAMFEID